MNKALQRFLPIVFNSLRSVITPAISILFSFIVVHYFSKQLWGEFVNILLFIYVATTISNWGNKDFLLRAFSKNPKDIISVWQSFLIARLPILLVFIVLVFFIYSTFVFWLILWLIAAYVFNSFSSVFIYKRDYVKAFSIEIVSFLVLILQLFLYRENISLNLLIKSYSLHLVVKSILFILSYKEFLKFKSFQLNFSLLVYSATFFLLSIAGFLQSKIDIYVFQFFSDDITLGEYQIISGFFIFSQSITMILVLPYVKNIYRMSYKSIIGIKKIISTIGFFLNSIIMVVIFLALKNLYDIHLSSTQLTLSFLIGYPCYIYSIDILTLFKKNKEIVVMKVSIIGLVINFVLSICLLSYGYNITGVLAANAIAQLFSLALYTQKRKSIYLTVSN